MFPNMKTPEIASKSAERFTLRLTSFFGYRSSSCKRKIQCKSARNSSFFAKLCNASRRIAIKAYNDSENAGMALQDDLSTFLQILPKGVHESLLQQVETGELVEISRHDLEAVQNAIGDFGADNRAGIEGTLHRVSAIRSRRGDIIGLTCRVGRAVSGHVDMVRDLLLYGESILFLGRPGVGKTTVLREIARVLADDLHKRVVIVDTSNEIGGHGDIPHPAIGSARRMQVPDPSLQYKTMIEAVENHMPEVVIVDEIGTEEETLACCTIAQRGVMLVGTAHGETLENLIKNPLLGDLIGGVQNVTLGDYEAQARRTQKSVLERKDRKKCRYFTSWRNTFG